MKSMYIYQFAKNVYWPKAYTTGDFTIGIYGSEDLFNFLNTSFKDKSLGQQKIKFTFINLLLKLMIVIFYLFPKNQIRLFLKFKKDSKR